MLLTIAGCTTSPSGIRTPEPVASYNSSKTLPAIEACIDRRLSHLGGTGHVHGLNETTLSFREGEIIALSVTLRRARNGTAIAVSSGYPYFEKTRTALESCL
jgi:hypothetical protein